MNSVNFHNDDLNNFDAKQVKRGEWAAENFNNRFEALPTDAPHVLPSSERHPDLELKQLPKFLKYAYLGGNQTFPVVISSSLTIEQEIALIDLLKSL